MFAVIHIPNFSLQAALRHEPDLRSRPAALMDPERPKPEIIQLNTAARSRGVAEGLTATQAMARCGELTIKRRSPALELAATEILWQIAYAFSPCVEATAPGVCTMELKGLGIQSEAEAQRRAAGMLKALAECFLDAHAGFAATPGLALLAARTGPVVYVRDPDTFISKLPLAALEPPPDISEILRRWGIRSVGEFVALGKAQVAERLGAAALELFERVSPGSLRPLKLFLPPDRFMEQMEFEHEIETIGPLLFVLRRFVEQLSCRLAWIYLVVGELELRFGLASGASCEHTFKIPSPTGDVETLFRMLHTHLENVRTESPVVSLQLSARPAEAETHQFGLFETTLRNPNQFAETLARLTALCGPDRAGTPVLEATHRPDAFRMKTPDFTAAPSAAESAFRPRGLPLRRFRPALAATVEFRGEQPARVHSPVFHGTVAGCGGPFFSSGHWWEPGRWAREEWDVQAADGALYRIFRSADGCFVEGVYD